MFLLLFIGFVRLPEVPADETHDRSSAVSFDYYTLKNFKYGEDVLVNVGPYGYLHYSRSYSGMHTVEKCIFGIAFALTVAHLILRTTEMFPSTATGLGWIVVVLTAPTQIGNPLWTIGEAFDYRSNFLILLSAVHLFGQNPKTASKFFDSFLVAFLALISLTKATSLVMVAMLGGVLAVVYVLQRNWDRLACGSAVFLSSFLFFWHLSGQFLSNLYGFLAGIFMFSSGYNEAMMVVDDAESLQMLLGVLALTLPLFLLIRLFLRESHLRVFLAPYLLFCFGFLFILWKHSLIRGGREPLFWNVAISCLPPMVAAAFHYASHRIKPRALTADDPPKSFQGSTDAHHLGIWVITMAFGVPVILSSVPIHTCLWRELPKNLYCLIFWNQHLKSMVNTLSETRVRLQMENTKREVGGASIDEFGTEPGWTYFNDFNYRPRPTPITFAAFNRPLAELNERFYRQDSTAPEYIMARFFAIQDRFGAQDDPFAVLEITRRYVPILIEKTHLLLKRRPAPQSPPRFEQIQNTETKLGEFVHIPMGAGDRIWCRVKIPYSILGHIRAFFCKPGPVYIEMESMKGENITKRFLASSGDTGFSVSPLIYDTQTLLNFYSPEASKLMFRAYKLRFVTRPQDAKYFIGNVNVRFETIDIR